MVDSEETCIVVMVYNTADSWGVLIGDTVVIPEPQVKRHSITHKDKVCVCVRKKNISGLESKFLKKNNDLIRFFFFLLFLVV